MGKAAREDVRQALIQRVSRKVSGHGVARRSIEGAVDRVLAALPAHPSAPPTATPAIAVFSAASSPDLGSRVRRAFGRTAGTVLGIGTATVGRHTVVTLRHAGADRSQLERIASDAGASLSIVEDAELGRVIG
jgi:hypothetical protein